MNINFNKKIDLIILAGGEGSRIKKFTKRFPKPLLKFDNKPLLQYIINYYVKFNFNKIFILAGYKGDQIYKKYNNKIINLINIKVIVEKKPLDTLGAVLNIKKIIHNDFILVNGDTVIDFNLENLINVRSQKKMSVVLNKNINYKKNKKLNNITVDKNNNVIFSKKNNFMSGGVYFINRSLLKQKIKRTSIENDLIPELIENKEIKGIINNKKFFIDIGTYQNLKKAKTSIPKFFKKPAIFFDRDGVINHDFGYVHRYKDFKFKKNILKVLKFLSKKNIYIFIVTNQAGIGKGYYSIKNFFKLQRKIKKLLHDKNIYIHDIKFSPYHPNAKIRKYRKNSKFRKPGNLMIEKIFLEWNLIRNKSFMIGDKLSDKLAAKKSNLYFEYPKKNIFNQIKAILKKKNIQ
jgi:D-glycero-D-manno-heptose 1,7-bisphosphate phosphatase